MLAGDSSLGDESMEMMEIMMLSTWHPRAAVELSTERFAADNTDPVSAETNVRMAKHGQARPPAHLQRLQQIDRMSYATLRCTGTSANGTILAAASQAAMLSSA